MLLVSAILVFGFLSTSLISFFSSKSAIRSAIVDSELPLTTDNIYSEIQKDLITPVFTSSMMASDTFLRDWILEGEKSELKVTKYLSDVKERSSATTSFLVSENTHKYYYDNAPTRIIDKRNPSDAWYFKANSMEELYEIKVDSNPAFPGKLIIYVNYQIYDYKANLIGVTGVGVTVDYVHHLISGYEKRYHRGVFFVDNNGKVVISGDKAVSINSNIDALVSLQSIKNKLLQHVNTTFEHKTNGVNYLYSVRYIPELKWYLMVSKNEADAISDIRNALLINLALCALVTSLALFLTYVALKRYQMKIEYLATTDSLTGLPNRTAFEIVTPRMISDSNRSKTPITILLFDLDYFKKINDLYGHNAGDLVLKELAGHLSAQVRKADFFCRWGGEEFLVMLKNCNSVDAVGIAENFRAAIAEMVVIYHANKITVTGSFGVASIRLGEDLDHLISRADSCLYLAKEKGRNQIVVDNT